MILKTRNAIDIEILINLFNGSFIKFRIHFEVLIDKKISLSLIS